MPHITPHIKTTRTPRSKAHRMLFGSRPLLLAVLLLGLVSLLTLAQTGIVATRGYAVAELQEQRTTLIRQNNMLEARRAAAASLSKISSRAQALGLQPIRPEQQYHLSIHLTPTLIAPNVFASPVAHIAHDDALLAYVFSCANGNGVCDETPGNTP